MGPERTFVSIYESNSVDRTPQLLKAFGDELAAVGAQHRIVSDTTNRWWPYGTSPERIGLLANARNRALEPLQSPDADVRLDDYDEFTKILFLNDVVFSWDAAVRLLATSLDGEEGENGYDLACGMDFGVTGESAQSRVALTPRPVRLLGRAGRVRHADARVLALRQGPSVG